MAGKVIKKGSIVYLNVANNWFQYDEKQKPLGAGAMGIVYKGLEQSTRRPVAIKRVIDRYANNPEIRFRAHQEAELMFSHPNLVEMLGCCEVSSESGSIYIISRYVQGQNIDTFINTSVRMLPNAEQRICELFFPVLDALAYIHSKGIIHMDIKPSNIMMEMGRNVRLMDLGIADVSETHSMSGTGMMGTPKYAAPEQFGDKTNKSSLTTATDIYEAGVTLYELLTMQNPFDKITNVEEAKELHSSLVLPYHKNMSKSVYEVLRKATEVNPQKRYQTANEMKMELRNAIMSQPKPTVNYKVIGIVVGFLILIGIIIILMIVFL